MKNKLKIFILSLITISCSLETYDNKNEVHVLPSNFEGIVIIFHSQNDQIDSTVIEGVDYIVYRIPKSGVLKTKISLESSSKQIKYYYENELEENELNYVSDYEKIPVDKVCVFGAGIGTFSVGKQEYDYTIYIVGSIKNADSLLNKSQTMDLEQLLFKK